MLPFKQVNERIRFDAALQWLPKGDHGKGGKGRYFSCCDPVTGEKSASFTVWESGAWRNETAPETTKGGDFISLYAYLNGVSNGDACKALAEQYGIPWQSDAPKQPKREETLAEFIAGKCLQESDFAPLKAYLSGRGISGKAIEKAILCKTLGFNTYFNPAKQPGEKFYGGEAAAFIVRSTNPGHVQAVDMRYFDAAKNGGLKTQCQGDKTGHFWTPDYDAIKACHTVVVCESSINALSIESAGLKGSLPVATLGIGNALNLKWEYFRGKRVLIALDKDHRKEDSDGKAHFAGQETAWALYDHLTDLGIACFLVDTHGWKKKKEVTEDDIKKYLESNPREKARLEALRKDNDTAGHEQEYNRIKHHVQTHGIDLNDYLQDWGAVALGNALTRVEQWLIPGVPGEFEKGRKYRVHLPPDDIGGYEAYRASAVHTWKIKRVYIPEKKDEDGNIIQKEETVETQEDVAGFRIASLRRVIVASAQSALSGSFDDQPKILTAAYVQTRTSGNELKKITFAKGFHNKTEWESENGAGAVLDEKKFKRAMVTLENTARNNEVRTANIVGVAWVEGKPRVIEGRDTYFPVPHQQCASYKDLKFHHGKPEDVKALIHAASKVYTNGAYLLMMTWAACTHLKIYLGFYPHLKIEASKSAGKSMSIETLGKIMPLEKYTVKGMNDYRIRISVSGTTFPVAFDEYSNSDAREMKWLNDTLQNIYTYNSISTKSEGIEFIQSAPVLVGGESTDDMRSVISKTVQATIKAEYKNGMINTRKVPKFPVRQWLEFIAGMGHEKVDAAYRIAKEKLEAHAASTDETGKRMITNYAAFLTGWYFLAEFAGVPANSYGMEEAITREMNHHIQSTDADREPWVWIIEKLCMEMGRGNYPDPWDVQDITHDGETKQCLVFKLKQAMDYVRTSQNMRDFRQGLPVKGETQLKALLMEKGILFKDSDSCHPRIRWLDRIKKPWRDMMDEPDANGYPQDNSETQRKPKQIRVSRCVALPIDVLFQYGIEVPLADYSGLIEGFDDDGETDSRPF